MTNKLIFIITIILIFEQFLFILNCLFIEPFLMNYLYALHMKNSLMPPIRSENSALNQFFIKLMLIIRFILN